MTFWAGLEKYMMMIGTLDTGQHQLFSLQSWYDRLIACLILVCYHANMHQTLKKLNSCRCFCITEICQLWWTATRGLYCSTVAVHRLLISTPSYHLSTTSSSRDEPAVHSVSYGHPATVCAFRSTLNDHRVLYYIVGPTHVFLSQSQKNMKSDPYYHQ